MATKLVPMFEGMTKDPGGGWSYIPNVTCVPDPNDMPGVCLDD